MTLRSRLSTRAEAGNLTDRVASMLCEQITGGGFQPGDVLPPEHQIAQRMGVSRTVLREAVSRLKVDGLVSSKPGRGLVVLDNRPSSVLRLYSASSHDLDEIISIVELRMGFESEAAAFAAARRSKKDLMQMREALDEMYEAIASGEVSLGVNADLGFHRAIAQATGNPNYISFFEFFTDLYSRNLLASRAHSARTARGEQAQKEHEAIYAAIERQDIEQARLAARRHIENTGERLRTTGNLLKPASRIEPASVGPTLMKEQPKQPPTRAGKI